MFSNFRTVSLTTKLSELSKIFNYNHFVVVTTTQQQYISNDELTEKSMITGILTRIDLLDYITRGNEKQLSDVNINLHNLHVNEQKTNDDESVDV